MRRVQPSGPPSLPPLTACGFLHLQLSGPPYNTLRSRTPRAIPGQDAPPIRIPPATHIFLVGLLALSVLYNIARWRGLDYSSGGVQTTPLIPSLDPRSLSFLSLSLDTCHVTFVEQNIFTVLLNPATIFYGGKYLERAWGSREFSKFIVTVTLIPNVVIIPI